MSYQSRRAAIYRKAKQQPWYHEPLPQCIAETHRQEQCMFTARYEKVGNSRITLCKTHADMADFPMKLIPESQIEIL
jgi:hypothetical protein